MSRAKISTTAHAAGEHGAIPTGIAAPAMAMHGPVAHGIESGGAVRPSHRDDRNQALSTRLFDLAERLIVGGFFVSFVFRMFGASAVRTPWTLLLLLAELLPVVYIVLRKPSATLSQRPLDWIVGIAGAVAPLLISPAAVHPIVPLQICLAFMIGGILLQIAAKIVLGRSFGIIAANRGVKVLGPYRFVRHPMYAGYTLTHIGFFLSMPLPMNAAFYVGALGLQIARIYREERILMRDRSYREFAARVRYRLLPGVF